MLEQIAILLAAAVLIVPLFKKLGLGTVLGYLIAGMVIGPWGLHFVTDVDSILHISELGVVLLLFVIGLELQPSRLWVLRHTVFGLGTAQVLCTAVAIALIAALLGQTWLAGAVIGFGLAMSSTAFVLQTLAEREELTSRHGRESFAILLFQDLAIIPALAILPLLAMGPQAQTGSHLWLELARALVVIVAMVTIGRQVLRWAFRLVARFGNRDLFTATALLVVIGAAMLMEFLGLSMSLGAFLAGVLLADSEFRHEIEAELEPFKGLLLGLFFIAVGMSVNLGVVLEMPALLLALALGLCVVKFAMLFAIGRASGGTADCARNLGIALAAGGEFAFVLFKIAREYHVVEAYTAEVLVVVVTLSMMLAPLLFLLNDTVLKRWAARHAEPEYDRIDEPGNPVVIAGFGRFGQIIARILHMRGIHFTALDASSAQVDFVRRFGSKIYYGDASRLNLLQAAKVEQAKMFVLAIGAVEPSLKIAQLLRQHFPHVPIYARARNRYHCYKLLDLDVEVLYRDTYLSSLELAREVLQGLGTPRADAQRSIELFREFDEALLKKQHAIYQDEAALIESVKQAADELQNLFEADAAASISPEPQSATAA
jgi:glutathione-regulated potassium-efflux system ancillary protein KefC/glutathione-regulated potassium-efflux system protein KefB